MAELRLGAADASIQAEARMPLIRTVLLVLILGQMLTSGALELRAGQMDLGAAGWSAFAPRDEIRPKCFVDASRHLSSAAALAISGDGNPLEYGGWSRKVGGIVAGHYYRMTAHFHADAVADERRQVVARLDWLDSSGNRVGQPDYAYEAASTGDWKGTVLNVPAPDGSSAVRIELILAWAPKGTVWWDDVALEPSQPPPDRWVRIGTVSLHPRNDPDNLGQWIRELDKIAAEKPDIVCLGEELLNEGNSRTYASTAEPIPGPSTARLGEAARRHGMYLVAGLIERDGHGIYNTSVLIDRRGTVAGKYRKVYLPREEIEGGLTPGNACPVFDTDFGRIGVMVCWDAEYIEPARALAFRGAEILLVPAAGGYLSLLTARALENHVYVVSSGYDVESAIIDPNGTVLFSSKASPAYKVVAVNLAQRFVDPWLGDMRPRFHKEIRTDLYLPSRAPE
jgi:predicted amidohydrolase